MALIAEQIVEEWLNRQGYFTIRGIKIGHYEIDLLALRHRRGGRPECRHIEVTASIRPIGFISKVQVNGRASFTAKRNEQELKDGVKAWVDKKFFMPKKRALMAKLWPGEWTSELVVNAVYSEAEVAMIEATGVRVIRLPDILAQLKADADELIIHGASGADFVALVQLGK